MLQAIFSGQKALQAVPMTIAEASAQMPAETCLYQAITAALHSDSTTLPLPTPDQPITMMLTLQNTIPPEMPCGQKTSVAPSRNTAAALVQMPPAMPTLPDRSKARRSLLQATL